MKHIVTYIYEKQTPFKVYVMCGLPGSGKSTWIKNNLGEDIPIVCKDKIREELGIMSNQDEKAIGTKKQEQEVNRINDERILDYCKKRVDFVVDNTHIGKSRQNMLQLLHKYGATIIGVNVNTPLSTCIKRREKSISADVIKKMAEGLIPLKDSEVDELINTKGTD